MIRIVHAWKHINNSRTPFFLSVGHGDPRADAVEGAAGKTKQEEQQSQNAGKKENKKLKKNKKLEKQDRRTR